MSEQAREFRVTVQKLGDVGRSVIVAPGATLQVALEEVHESPDAVTMVIRAQDGTLRNGDLNQELRDGDSVVVSPKVAGG